MVPKVFLGSLGVSESSQETEIIAVISYREFKESIEQAMDGWKHKGNIAMMERL